MKINAGSEIDAWCTSCRLNLNHRVVAMVGEAAKRVQCLTCNKQHNYRAPRTEDAPKAKAAGASKTKASARVPAYRKEWEGYVEEVDESDFVPYSTHSSLEVGQLIEHAKFGRGYVKESMGAQKVSVLFADGARTLIHGLS